MMCYGEMTRHAEAEEFCKIISISFLFPETAWFEMGQFYFNRKTTKKTIQSFDYLLAINSDAAGFMPIKQRVMKRWNNGKKTIEVYEEQLELEYTKSFYFFTKLDCATKQPKNMEALRAFQKSLRRPSVLSFDDGTKRPLFGNGKHEKAYILLKKQLR